MIDFILKKVKCLYLKNIDNDEIFQEISSVNALLPHGKKEKDKLIESAVLMLMDSINSKNYKKSFGLARIIFMCDFDNPLDVIKEKGAFRASKYSYQTKLLMEVINDLYARNFFSNDMLDYIKSVNGLLLLASDILSMRIKIISFIKSRPFFLKTALCLAEIRYHDVNKVEITEDTSFRERLYFSSKEEILSSISYILQIYKEVQEFPDSLKTVYIDEKISDEVFETYFYYAHHIQRYNESEINVDFFGYSASLDKNAKTIIIHNEDFETAKCQGYTKTELRWQAQQFQFYNSEEYARVVKFYDFMDQFWAADERSEKSYIYEVSEFPIKRIRLLVTFLSYAEEINIFSNKKMFLEEIVMLEILTAENYNNDFLNKKLYKQFTVFDIIKIQRFFNYVSYIYHKVYKKLTIDEPLEAYLIRKRSVLPVFKTDELSVIFQKICGCSREDCLDLIGKISTIFSSKSDVIDIQYQPIIKMGESSLILPTVFACSNLIRSFAHSEKIHLSTFECRDYMIRNVNNAFKSKGFKVNIDFNYSKDEVDVVAFLDGYLFLFECKNPFHPVNDFELRNTYSHIKKGFSQINKFKRILSDKHHFRQFLKNLNIDLELVKEIHYAIINANRALSGLQHDNIKVLHANELIGFLETGRISVADDVYRCWECETFKPTDLVKFLSGEFITSDFEKSKTEIFYGYPLRSYTMAFKTYAFELDKIATLSEKNYCKIDMLGN
ncbi:hypothetical protein [Pluralibacter sp.]|uniref:hypothetical protein n=1 Tax=Pluralibacter sp. TaxID=1920032 RepID=UPI0025E98564|nr:hypothetical protein [Pluralibacter sp.]MBV8042429.1 hypothetical protein [Pluralibacter sp.]